MLIYQPALLEQVNDHLQNNIYQNTIQNLFVKICSHLPFFWKFLFERVV